MSEKKIVGLDSIIQAHKDLSKLERPTGQQKITIAHLKQMINLLKGPQSMPSYSPGMGDDKDPVL